MNTEHNKCRIHVIGDPETITQKRDKWTRGGQGGTRTTDLLLQLGISDGSLSGRDWTVVNEGSPLSVSIGDMAIDRVVTGISLAANKPTERG